MGPQVTKPDIIVRVVSHEVLPSRVDTDRIRSALAAIVTPRGTATELARNRAQRNAHAVLGTRMVSKSNDWQARVMGILKAELKRRDISYRDLAEKLEAIGVKDSERNISNKIARGSFTAVFFVQCLKAIGCQTLHLEQD